MRGMRSSELWLRPYGCALGWWRGGGHQVLVRVGETDTARAPHVER